jgi:hypothetical protein
MSGGFFPCIYVIHVQKVFIAEIWTDRSEIILQ